MQYTIVSALAFAATAYAQVFGFDTLSTPVKGEQVPAGKTYTIVWAPAEYKEGTATISLLGGKDDGSLQVLSTIASGIPNAAGSYQWAVDASLGDQATYGIKIALDSDPKIFQYGFPFAISKSSSGSSSSGYPVSAPTSSSTSKATVSSTGYPVSSASSTHKASSSAAQSTTTVKSSSAYPTVAPTGNLSTTAIPTTLVTPTTLASLTSATATRATTTSSTSIPTAAADRVAAGSLALIGGIAAAIFAL